MDSSFKLPLGKVVEKTSSLGKGETRRVFEELL